MSLQQNSHHYFILPSIQSSSPEQLSKNLTQTNYQLQQCLIKIQQLQKINQDLQTSSTQLPSSKQHRQLRMLLQDSQFQIRKMKQDMATERTIAEIQRMKLVKNYEQKVAELKRQLEFQNESWIKRFDLRNVEFKKEMERTVLLVEEKCNEEMSVVTGKYEQQIKEVQRRKEESENHLKKELVIAVEKCEKEKKQAVQGLDRRWKQKVRDVENRLVKQFEREKQQLEGKYNSLQQQKKQQQQKSLTAKVKMDKLKQCLNKDIQDLKQQKQCLQSKYRELSYQKQQLEKQNTGLVSQAIKITQTHKETIKNLEQKHVKESEQIKLNQKSSTEKMLQIYASTIQRFEEQIKDLISKHQTEIEEYNNHLETIKNCYDQRPSRSEDMQMIRLLEDRLWKKENELEIVGKDLKEYRLELENKEEVYTKIFTNGSALRELKFPVDRTQLRMPLTMSKQHNIAKSRKGKSLLGRVCHTKNSSFSENAPLTQVCSKIL